ncbi:hypothetical protein EB796_016272 [Bugula neritina]|uniref:Uncharacterized protein n=1 Tax=Bugula neritina TaxID=10212 RepID=A0A7J7JGH1_BUGNE|nr:hypothetical protein EB796_016475 [Bugula neritina]KAF6025432.1 hypothetical protein EB796_016272 [Bugula neritina]
MGEFDEYDIYEMVAASKGKEKPLFDLLCVDESHKKLNSCGGGLSAMLEPGSWKDGKGTSYTEEEADDDDEDYRDEL